MEVVVIYIGQYIPTTTPYSIYVNPLYATQLTQYSHTMPRYSQYNISNPTHHLNKSPRSGDY